MRKARAELWELMSGSGRIGGMEKGGSERRPPLGKGDNNKYYEEEQLRRCPNFLFIQRLQHLEWSGNRAWDSRGDASFELCHHRGFGWTTPNMLDITQSCQSPATNDTRWSMMSTVCETFPYYPL